MKILRNFEVIFCAVVLVALSAAAFAYSPDTAPEQKVIAIDAEDAKTCANPTDCPLVTKAALENIVTQIQRAELMQGAMIDLSTKYEKLQRSKCI